MAFQLPYVETLGEAVHEVIKGKNSSKYIAKFYKDIILSSTHPEDLLEACKKFIEDTSILSKVYDGLAKEPFALTIEDFVAAHGTNWGFNNYTIKLAKDRVKTYNDIAGQVRYEHNDNGGISFAFGQDFN